MSKPVKLKKGDRLVCTHYTDRPVVKFTGYNSRGDGLLAEKAAVWVVDDRGPWWGPRSWFRKLPARRQKKVRVRSY